MARKGYPFSSRDVRYGTNLISSLFAVPISAVASSLLSSSGGGNYDNPYKFELFKDKYLRLKYILYSICAILCPIAGMITFTFVDWWMFCSILLFSILGIVFLIPSTSFVEKVKRYYIYDKETYPVQVGKCKSLLKMLIGFNIVYLILTTYPFISMILYAFFGVCEDINGIYLSFWDGGPFPLLMIFFVLFICLLSFMPLHDAYKAFKHFDEYIAENPSIIKIKHKEVE